MFQSKATLVLAALLLSCGHPAKTEQPAAVKAPSIFPDPAPHSREANDAARFLAGLPGSEGSAFHQLEQQDAWKLHRKELDRMWSRSESETINAIRDFQTKELNDASIRNSLIFYPFSGPDALMVNTFFPNNTTYVMVGLEPPGTLPTPKQFGKKNLAVSLGEQRTSVNDVLGKSFFITRQMDRQFRGQVTDGLFQPIVHLLVRTNHTILGFRYVQLSDDGKVIERSATGPSTTKVPNRGVEVDFTSQGSETVRRLFYFSINISDEKLKDNQAFGTFVGNLKTSAGDDQLLQSDLLYDPPRGFLHHSRSGIEQ